MMMRCKEGLFIAGRSVEGGSDERSCAAAVAEFRLNLFSL